MASGHVHFSRPADAIAGIAEPDLQAGSPDVLVAHGLSVDDVDVHGVDSNGVPTLEQGLHVRFTGSHRDGSERTVEVLIDLEDVGAFALSLALTLDEARTRAAR